MNCASGDGNIFIDCVTGVCMNCAIGDCHISIGCVTGSV